MKAPSARQPQPNSSRGESLKRSSGLRIQWIATGDEIAPYRAFVNGEKWVIRINDFPAEHLYSLIVDEREMEHFDDWPSSWLRPEKGAARDAAASEDDIALADLVKCLRSLLVDSPERQARIEEIARAYARGVYRVAEERAARIIDDAIHKS